MVWVNYWNWCHGSISLGHFLVCDYSLYISVFLLRKGHWFSCLGTVCHFISHCQARADVVALWLICGRPGNVTCLVHTMVISNQLQMFPVTPAKLFCSPLLCCKMMPCCKFYLNRICRVLMIVNHKLYWLLATCHQLMIFKNSVFLIYIKFWHHIKLHVLKCL